MSDVEFDEPPAWSHDATETMESTKYPTVGVVEVAIVPFLLDTINPTASTQEHFVLSSISSRDQELKLSTSMISPKNRRLRTVYCPVYPVNLILQQEYKKERQFPYLWESWNYVIAKCFHTPPLLWKSILKDRGEISSIFLTVCPTLIFLIIYSVKYESNRHWYNIIVLLKR